MQFKTWRNITIFLKTNNLASFYQLKCFFFPSYVFHLIYILLMFFLWLESGEVVAWRPRQDATDVIGRGRPWKTHQHVALVHCRISHNQWCGSSALRTAENNRVSSRKSLFCVTWIMDNKPNACLRQNHFVTFKNFNYLKGNCFDSHCFLNSLMYSNSAGDYALKAKLGGEQRTLH